MNNGNRQPLKAQPQLRWTGGGSCLSIREKDHYSTLLPGQSLKSSHLQCYGDVIAPVAWVTCTSVTAPLTPRGNYRPWNNIWCQQRDHILFRNVPRLKDHAEQNSAQAASIRLPCLQSRLIHNFKKAWLIMKHRMQQQRQWPDLN